MKEEEFLDRFTELIALIDKPTESDLLKVIFSSRVTDAVIKMIPKDSITPRVAALALTMKKANWVWISVFGSKVPRNKIIGVLQCLFSQGPWSDVSDAVGIFASIKNPTEAEIESYLNICYDNDIIGLQSLWNTLKHESYTQLINTGLTNNLKHRLTEKQQIKLIDKTDPINLYERYHDELKEFISQPSLFNKCKNDYLNYQKEKGEEDEESKKSWWHSLWNK